MLALIKSVYIRQGDLGMKKLAIIILDWNGAEDTIECLKCLNNYELYDVYLLENGSTEENVEKVKSYLEVLKSKINIEIFRDSSFYYKDNVDGLSLIHLTNNLGFAGGNNYIAEGICDHYEYLLCLNNDTEVPENSIEHMLQTAIEIGTTALTCDIRFYSDKGRLWNAGGVFTFYGERRYFPQRQIDALEAKKITFIPAEFITGCALLIKADYVLENGLFTEKFFHGEEDFNLCYHLKQKNDLVGVDLSVRIYHKVGRTIGRTANTKKQYSQMVLHTSNRIIDFKSFYGNTKWIVWRELYLIALLLVKIKGGVPLRIALSIIRRVKSISSQYDSVNKPLFDEIMSIDWDLN